MSKKRTCENARTQDLYHFLRKFAFMACMRVLSSRKDSRYISHPPVILYYCSFQCDTSFVVLIVLCFGVGFLCCLHPMYVFIFLMFG